MLAPTLLETPSEQRNCHLKNYSHALSERFLVKKQVCFQLHPAQDGARVGLGDACSALLLLRLWPEPLLHLAQPVCFGTIGCFGANCGLWVALLVVLWGKHQVRGLYWDMQLVVLL